MSPDLFVGRVAELDQIAETLRRVAGGEPWLVAIEGDPGMGKSALARQALADVRVLSARADQADADLDFGLADQLFRVARGPVPAILPGTGPAASAFTVGAQLLQVVGELASVAPTVLLVEDLQWADRKSLDALTFTLRRLSVDPVAAVVTYRGPGSQLDQAVQRLLAGLEHRVHFTLGGLSRARGLFAALRATPFTEQADQELAACHLPRSRAAEKKSYLELTSRETEVAHLVGQGLSNPEIAAELFVSRKAVEYHLGNIYGKYGIHSRRELRRLVGQWRAAAVV